MVDRFYYNGKSRRYNDMFVSSTSGDTLVFPYAISKIRHLSEYYKGYKQILYLEKPCNSNSLFFIVFTINDDPYRLGTRNLNKVEGELERLPDSVVEEFNKSGYCSVYY